MLYGFKLVLMNYVSLKVNMLTYYGNRCIYKLIRDITTWWRIISYYHVIFKIIRL